MIKEGTSPRVRNQRWKYVWVPVCLLVYGCDVLAEVAFQLRVSDAQTAEAIADACVATGHFSFTGEFLTEQGRTDLDGVVEAVEVRVLDWRTLDLPRYPLLVRVHHGDAEETIEVEFASGAVGRGSDFQVELISFEIETSGSDFDTPPGCTGEQ